MSTPPRQIFEEHSDFEPQPDGTCASVVTAFDGVVRPTAATEEVRADVTVTAPMLDAAAEDEIAPIVEDGWYETFERRVTSVGGIFRTGRTLEPTVTQESGSVVVTATLTDQNARRAADDASALINFIEGTYVQGVIPGYSYTEPVAGLLESAKAAAGSE